MKSLSKYIMESNDFCIPSYTTGAMVDLLSCKSEQEVLDFFMEEGLDDESIEMMDISNIWKSIMTLNKHCDFWTVDSDMDLIDTYAAGNISSEAVRMDLDIPKAKCWVVYTTDGDSDMLIIRGKNTSAEKVLKQFVDCCERNTIVAYSWL